LGETVAALDPKGPVLLIIGDVARRARLSQGVGRSYSDPVVRRLGITARG
jgi:hypothetical protein